MVAKKLDAKGERSFRRENIQNASSGGELAFGTVDSWLIHRLTRGSAHVTDPTNASRTMLYDIHAGDWDEALLSLFRIPRALLPRVLPSSQVYGESAKKIFGAPIPIAGIAGDQQAALFGQACHAPGMAKNTYGTGCFMLMNTGSQAVPSRHGLLTTIAWELDGAVEYALEGSIFVAGSVVQWLRDELQFFRSAAEIEALAASVPDNGGVFLVPAFTGLGAPHWDPFARGAILGLTRGSSRAHLARAALESIAFQVADLLEAMQRDAGAPEAARGRRAPRSRAAAGPKPRGCRRRRAETPASSSQLRPQLAVVDDGLAVEPDTAMAQRQVVVSQRVASRDLVGAGGVQKVAGERALLGAVDVAPVVHGERIPPPARVHSPADVRDRACLAPAPAGPNPTMSPLGMIATGATTVPSRRRSLV